MNLEKLIKTGKTVFSTEDIQKIFNKQTPQALRNYLSKMGKKGILQNLAYGIRGLTNYDPLELACKVKKKSYISFETVLKQEGVIFQYQGETIFLASDNTGTKKTKDFTCKYNKVHDRILLNPIGISHHKNYSIASKERAICDKLYLYSGYYFDVTENIDFDKLEEIAKIYNKRVLLEVKKLRKNA